MTDRRDYILETYKILGHEAVTLKKKRFKLLTQGEAWDVLRETRTALPADCGASMIDAEYRNLRPPRGARNG